MAKDPYKYFRIEAREILEGLAQGVLSLESGATRKDVVDRLFRYAHTLKGAARVVKQPAIADGAHAIEDLLSPHRTSTAAVPRDTVDELLRRIDAMTVAVRALGQAEAEAPTPEQRKPVSAPEKPPPPDVPGAPEMSPVRPAPPAIPASTAGDEQLETVRVEIREMDLLLDDIFQTSAQIIGMSAGEAALADAKHVAAALIEHLGSRRSVRNATAAMERARSIAEELAAGLEQAERRLAQGRDAAEGAIRLVRERAHRLRLVPASTVFPALERATRDAARASAVDVEFVAAGGEHRLDGHVLLAVRDALLHVVRNAVAHGIEGPDERARAGKPRTGSVRLRVDRRGHQVVFTCQDDGRGIDVESVRRIAVARGAITADRARDLPAQAAMQLVFLPGVSTSRAVTELAGRGVGLDVVRDTARRFKGDAEIHSELGRTTAVEIRVPVSLSSMAALLIEAGGVHALPLDATIGALRVQSGDILRTDGKDSVLYRDRAIPFSTMAALLGTAQPSGVARRAWSAIVLRAQGRLAAVGVDRLLGTTELVVKPLPALAGPVPMVMGASMDADGNAQLMLDPRALVDAMWSWQGRASEPVRPARPPILVIDDSLTTRMLEQSILESAGYEVDVATSAEEALEKARARSYGLFVCDVEMPGMDGYGFVTTTRADAKLREVPVIMVTSLSTAENRQRGLDAGASDYIVKGEFDQGRLLNRIRTLLG